MKVGQIIFYGGSIQQNWNPHMMSRDQRKNVAAELEEIAARIRRGYFEDKGKLKRFKAPSHINRGEG